MKIHFEIGTNWGRTDESTSVYSCNSLKECLIEWKQMKYTEPKYWIDVWEGDYPLANIKIEDWIF